MTVRQYQVGIFSLTTSRGITIQAQIFSRPGNTPASGKILSGNLKMTPVASFWVTDGDCRPSSSLAIFSMQRKKEAAFNKIGRASCRERVWVMQMTVWANQEQASTRLRHAA